MSESPEVMKNIEPLTRLNSEALLQCIGASKCCIKNCTKHSVVASFGYCDGDYLVIPSCEEHRGKPHDFEQCLVLKQEELIPFYFEVNKYVVQYLVENSCFPIVVRMPTQTDTCSLIFRNKEGILGQVMMLIPFVDGDRAVKYDTSLAPIVEKLLSGASIEIMGNGKYLSIKYPEDFVPFQEPLLNTEVRSTAPAQ